MRSLWLFLVVQLHQAAIQLTLMYFWSIFYIPAINRNSFSLDVEYRRFIESNIESNLELNGWGESIESNLESNLWWIDENEWMNRGTVTLPVLELGDLHTVLITSTVHHLAVFARSEQTELKQIQIRFFAFGSWNGMHGMHGIIIKWFMPIVGHSIKDICNKKARSSVRDGISTPITNIFQKHRHIHTHRHKHSHTQAQTHSHTQTHPHTNTNATSTNFNYYLNHICLSSPTPLTPNWREPASYFVLLTFPLPVTCIVE